MRKTCYIETSIPSYYFETRETNDCVAKRDWTREFWRMRESFEFVTANAVLEELRRGDYPMQQQCLELLVSLPCLHVANEIPGITETYIRHLVMPRQPLGDALHLALASFHRCDFIVTWNCAHLANPHKQNHIRIINATMGLFTPGLVTPYELLEGREDNG